MQGLFRNKVIFLCIMAGMGLLFSASCFGGEDWQERKATHFIIYYHKDIAEDYIDKVVDFTERYYQRIAENLGFNRFNFWLWNNRARVYIYKDQEEYQAKSGQPHWSGGAVSIKEKIIWTFPWQEGFFDRLLAHELGHIIFREFVGEKAKIPLWLDEGVAMLQEERARDYDKEIIIGLRRLEAIIPIEELNKIERETLIVPEIFYAQSMSIVNYLLVKFGEGSFARLCRYLRDGRSLEEAIASTYRFRDLKGLNDAWLEYLQEGD